MITAFLMPCCWPTATAGNTAMAMATGFAIRLMESRKLTGSRLNTFTTISRPTIMATEYTAPTIPARTAPFLESGIQVPIISAASSRLCPIMIVVPSEIGMPNPITRPKFSAKLVAASSFLVILPSRYSGRMGLSPSLKTATLRLTRNEATPPINAIRM